MIVCNTAATRDGPHNDTATASKQGRAITWQPPGQDHSTAAIRAKPQHGRSDSEPGSTEATRTTAGQMILTAGQIINADQII